MSPLEGCWDLESEVKKYERLEKRVESRSNRLAAGNG